MPDTPKTLVLAYDVTGMTFAQVDALTGEALVQAEASDDHDAARAIPVGTFVMPLDRVQGACEIAAESWDPDEDDEPFGLMLCSDGAEADFIDLRDGDDTFNAAAERTALDKAYQLKESNPGAVVSVVVVFPQDPRPGA